MIFILSLDGFWIFIAFGEWEQDCKEIQLGSSKIFECFAFCLQLYDLWLILLSKICKKGKNPVSGFPWSLRLCIDLCWDFAASVVTVYLILQHNIITQNEVFLMRRFFVVLDNINDCLFLKTNVAGHLEQITH